MEVTAAGKYEDYKSRPPPGENQAGQVLKGRSGQSKLAARVSATGRLDKYAKYLAGYAVELTAERSRWSCVGDGRLLIALLNVREVQLVPTAARQRGDSMNNNTNDPVPLRFLP